MTSLKGNLSSVDLANIFQMLSMNQREGTLYIFDGQSRKAIYFGREGVSMLTRGKHKPDALGRILIRGDKITPEQLQEALRLQDETSGRLIGQILVEQGWITRADVEDALKTQIEEEVYSLFIWKDAQFEFVEGPPDEEFKGSDGVARLTFSVNSLIMEAAKRVDEWEWIQRVIPSTEEIFRYTGNNVALEDEIFAQPCAGKVLAAVDAKRSVEEIIDVSCVNRFEVTKMLALLLEGGAIEALPVAELRREAHDALAAGDTDAAVKFLTRLVALKGDTPDMHRQLAEVFEARRLLEKAAFHYKVYAEILADNGERTQAFETYLRITDFLPTDLAAADRMIEIFASNPDGLEQHGQTIIAKGKMLAEIYGELGRQSRAIQVLHRVVALGPEDQDLRQRLIQVYLQAGMPGEAIAEYDALAETALAVRDYDQAERIYRKILQIDRNREDAQARLAQLLSKKRLRQRGLRLGVAAAVLLAVGGVGAFRGWQWYREQKQAEVAASSEFGSRLADLQASHVAVHASLEHAVQALASAFGDPGAMARELKDGAAARKDAVEKANAAIASYHELGKSFPAVADVERARDAANALQNGVSRVGIQEDKLKAALTRAVDDLFDKLEPGGQFPPPFSLDEQDKLLREITQLAVAVPGWQGGDKGQRAQSYATNVANTLNAFREMRADVAASLDRSDVPGAQARIVDFLVEFLPPRDLLEQIEVPRLVASRPAGARIEVDGEDAGLVTPAVVRLPFVRKATLRIVKDGFQPATTDLVPPASIDRTTVAEKLRLTIEEVLHKDLAFKASLGAKLVAPPAIAGDRVLVPTRGSETGVFDLNGLPHGTFTTKSGSGVLVRPLVFDDVVVLATYEATLFPFRVSTGEALAREPLPGKIQADPVQWRDLAIFADLDGHISAYVVRPRAITKAWTYPVSGTANGFRTAPVVVGDDLVALASDGLVHVVDCATGAARRPPAPIRDGGVQLPLATGVAATEKFLLGVVRAEQGQSRVVSVDRESLTVRSSFLVDGNVKWAPLVWQGFAYVVSDEGTVTSIRLVDGVLQSAHATPLGPGLRVLVEPTLDDGVLYVGDSLGTLWALDVRGVQPERLYDFRVPGSDRKVVSIATRPVVSGGYVLFGASDNVVYGLKK